MNNIIGTPTSAYSNAVHGQGIYNISQGKLQQLGFSATTECENGCKVVTYRKCISYCMELQFVQIFAELPEGIFVLKQCFTILQFEGELLLDVKNLAEMQEVIKLICKYFAK